MTKCNLKGNNPGRKDFRKASSSFRAFPADLIQDNELRETETETSVIFTGGPAHVYECIFSVSQLVQLIDC